MKSIEYRGYLGDAEFGELLNTEDTADSWETSESHLYQKDDRYFWLTGEGCSCFDGEYHGWSLTKRELLKLAGKRSKDIDGYRGPSHEKLMGIWIKENIK